MILSGVKKKIVINAGHHDNDSGKVISTEVHKEADEVKKIRDEVVRLLTEHTDFEVFAVPDELDLVESIAYANEKVPLLSDGLVIDIHLNANNNRDVRGVEGYYGDTETSKEIAAALSKATAEALKIPNRGAFPDTMTFVGSLGWIRKTNGWASLIEVCYMTNAEDWATLNADGGHELAAKGIVDGICDIYGEERINLDKKTEQPITLKGWAAFISALLAFLKVFANKQIKEERATNVKEAHEHQLLQKKNVVGVGVGPRNKTGETAVVVLVTKKEDLGALDEHDAVPEYIDGVRTDVLEIGEVEAMAGVHTDRKRPVHGGLSAIWQKGTACTLGAIVYKNGKPYALQNTHCANPHWKGAQLGDKIIQPSGNDGGSKTGTRDVIGTSAEFLELQLDGKTLNPFDSALVELSVDATPLYQEGLGGHERVIGDVNVGDVVWKSGRTTGVQSSKVIAKNVTVSVNYGQDKPGLFKGQILAENKDGYFTSGGDSSSLVLNTNRQPVGQIFAGSDKVAIFSPIKPIMDHFGFSFSPDSVTEGYVALAVEGGDLYTKVIPEFIQPGMQVDTKYRLNLRSSAGVSAERIDIIDMNERLEVVDKPVVKDGYVWAKVRIK